MLIIHMNPDTWAGLDAETQDKVMNGHDAFQTKIRATGEMVGTWALADTEKSSVVRLDGGKRTVTDGPYLEAKEFLAGYYVIEADSRDRALEIAAMMPEVEFGGLGIEVREIVHYAGPTA
ncbi:YciI family protein [Amycolatopsis sp. NPDC059657]|uniref:YciI family protein n=1 Tax=Amycolatopsis sp. NPDC059657 TaxID=3346899 RepID=UPI00366DCCBF